MHMVLQLTIDATHQCMTMRGIKKEKATTITNYFTGKFKKDFFQNGFLRYISGKKLIILSPVIYIKFVTSISHCNYSITKSK